MAVTNRTDLANTFNEVIASGTLGTQLFWFEERPSKTEMVAGTPVTTTGKLVYAVPLTDEGGGEYGGDIESYEAPEADLARIPKIAGRQSLEDVTYTSNYTPARFKRWKEILHSTEPHTFVEVYEDLSAHIVRGSGQFTKRAGNPSTIEATIVPENMAWVENILAITEDEWTAMKEMFRYKATTGATTYSYMLDGETAPSGSTTKPAQFVLETIPANRVSKVEAESAL